ncbi:hypothetical protein B1R64_08465 [Salmonella enterica subsp. enterica serovar Weltevreden]|nr:hypothetical protein [Salmonella enterica]EGI6117590.1 hypothetical protein [Salmonella enterica subsp. enterica serovar Weltevreden]PRT80637.1 hypothetical protein B1R58_24645 [Salmonella enterica subsp. enterica serovar Weltevreden]PRT80899.1 hypothetical protein B1R47_24245 [Salmonella enterica subsp. enterica serovar Weltevreden]PRT91055.1 hypothetical protein B1R69_04695 [Salmonella enterica subsp. enterica serovar Weltevreden]
MFSQIRGLISCQSNTQTIAPTLSPPSSGHVSFAGVDYPLLPLDHQTPFSPSRIIGIQSYSFIL